MSDIEIVAPLAGWAIDLADVPDPVFAQGMMGDGVAIDPVGDTLHAPCAATVLTLHAAGHAISLRTDDGAELLMHIGIDSVAMAGRGFTPLVGEGDRVARGDPLIRFDLDALVCGASAAVTPVIVTSPGYRISSRITGRAVAVGDPLLRLVPATQDDSATVDVSPDDIVRRSLRVAMPHGLHARPAARIVAAVRALDATAALVVGDRRATCDGPIGLLGLGIGHGSDVTIEAAGPDAPAAIDAIVDLLTHDADAPAAAPAPPPLANPVTLADGLIGGITAAPGLAIGTATWLRATRPAIPPAADAATEEKRLLAGIADVRQALSADHSGHAAGVLAAHLAILDDPALLAAARALVAAGRHAAAAYLDAADAQADQLAALADRRIAERADDLRDVGLRVAYAILGTAPVGADLPDRAILLADDLLPSQLIALDTARLAGIAVSRGGPTSHVAILAAGIGVPMLVATGAALHDVADGTVVLLDADQGYCDPAPAPDLIARTEQRLATQRAAEARAIASGGAQTVTADGQPIGVYANLGSVDDARAAAAVGAEGCGLLRTEFLFLDRATPPDRGEQAACYGAIADTLAGRPVVIRLLDIGGDKPAPYLALPMEENPALGLRGIRVSLARPDILETQLRAILDVSALAHCRIMVPMVSGVAEIAAVRAMLDRLRDERALPPVSLGAMVETPAAAIAADLIAPLVDFLSIGTNDLTQYALAMDRGNPAVAAGLDGLHPAVLRLIGATCDGAAKHAMPVSVCGGLAADPLAVPILIGLGVRTLSVPPARIAATKALLATLTLDNARAHARSVRDCPTADQVRAQARAFAQERAA